MLYTFIFSLPFSLFCNSSCYAARSLSLSKHFHTLSFHFISIIKQTHLDTISSFHFIKWAGRTNFGVIGQLLSAISPAPGSAGNYLSYIILLWINNNTKGLNHHLPYFCYSWQGLEDDWAMAVVGEGWHVHRPLLRKCQCGWVNRVGRWRPWAAWGSNRLGTAPSGLMCRMTRTAAVEDIDTS